MTLLLKQLHIHGFKSFATPTTFAFDRGMTAVIGPNGSGKSNVAEALRWVLGEQAGSNLRSRKTEDVIFAGSDKRPQLAMAEVILTLENPDGDLPLPFAEITVARRAFRTGENQYLINGARVRLKDVQQLVSPLGQSYTIIGQGLVDAALSQRPEERRGLFEHAAGISGLRLRANEAERSLTEASGNAQRLRDILSELEPRVRSLERQARLAREYGAVREQLTTMHRRYYGALWSDLSRRLDSARLLLHEVEERHEQQERRHGKASRHLAGLRGTQRRLVEESSELRELLIQRERQLAELEHKRALLGQRAHTDEERLSDLRAGIAELELEQAILTDEIERGRANQAALSERVATMDRELRDHDARLDVARARRAEAQRAVADTERQQREHAQELARIEGSLQGLAERRAAIERELHDGRSVKRSAAARIADLEREIAATHQQADALRRKAEAIDRDRDAVERLILDARGNLNEVQSRIDESEREQTQAQGRLELLERAHASGEGLYSGVRAVLRAVRKGDLQLPGLIGTVAETVEAPGEYETAIEVALGGHLQDIIVAEWSDAQAAIEFLNRANAGRATFQPLDTVSAARPLALDVRDAGIAGIAAALVQFPERVRSVVEQILGRTLIVLDLDAAKRMVRQAPGWTLVTLGGEITRPSGAVTGGSRVQEAGMLARERERRTLPRILAEQRTALSALQTERNQITRDTTAHANNLERLHRESETLVRDTRAIEHDIARLTRDHADSSRQQATIEQQLAAIERRQQQLAADERDLLIKRDERATSQLRLADILEQLVASTADVPVDMDAGGSDMRADLAAARERLRAENSDLERRRERSARLSHLLVARGADIARLAESGESAAAQQAALDSEVASLAAVVSAERDRLVPLDIEQEATAASLSRAERALHDASEQLRAAERERDRATLALARVQDEQVFLQERVRNDLDVSDPALVGSEASDEPIPTDTEIARLRERLRRMSVVSEDVLEQYETESARLAYLADQLADVDAAAAGLRTVLADLNASMSERFTETFRDVAVMFEQTFTRLFGGGIARLVLGATDDTSAGIDIVAQPPGKRLQNLNALSGGERTLTAIALLIAIQRVNPSPFCLLDEVDAALDETNVVRFRDELRELTTTTQFVVITHNRGTIEGADTLYGVTMGDDGMSRVLSLRLEDAIRAVDEYASVAVADA